jgi:hypothetical protein
MATDQPISEALQSSGERLREAIDGELRDLGATWRRLLHERDDESRKDLELAVGQARQEAERVAEARLESVRNDLTQELTGARTELEGLRASLRQTIPAITMAQLVASMRRLDEAKSLHTILQILVESAAAQTAGRASVMVVDGGTLRAWAHVGFAADATPVDLGLGQSAVLQTALSQRHIVPVMSKGESNDPVTTPAFMRISPSETGMALPIVVGADVVALLYADDKGRRADQQAATWAEEVEILVRHASLRLASVTSVRTVELLTSPA